MPLQDKYRIALLSAYALALHSIEGLLPAPVPWMRLGFANIITLTTLLLYGFRSAMMVTLIRVVLGSLFTGTFLGPGFFLSLGGGVAGTVAMGYIRYAAPRIFGAVGISLIGALFHNIAQLCIAYFLFIQKAEPLLFLLPFITLLGTLTGAINGFISDILVTHLKKSRLSIQNENS